MRLIVPADAFVIINLTRLFDPVRASINAEVYVILVGFGAMVAVPTA